MNKYQQSQKKGEKYSLSSRSVVWGEQTQSFDFQLTESWIIEKKKNNLNGFKTLFWSRPLKSFTGKPHKVG